jgi:hypothetical protein
MRCPHCRHEFPLTWRRYWKEPTGKHACPSCHKKSPLNYRLQYVAFILAFGFAALVLARLLSIGVFGDQWHSRQASLFRIGVYAVSMVLFFPLDKGFDSRFRKLVK